MFLVLNYLFCVYIRNFTHGSLLAKFCWPTTFSLHATLVWRSDSCVCVFFCGPSFIYQSTCRLRSRSNMAPARGSSPAAVNIKINDMVNGSEKYEVTVLTRLKLIEQLSYGMNWVCVCWLSGFRSFSIWLRVAFSHSLGRFKKLKKK